MLQFSKFKPIPKIDPEEIKKYKPKDNEHFVGYSTSMFSESKNINGVKSGSSGSNIVVNVDGEVTEKSIVVDHHDDTSDANPEQTDD